MRGCAFFGGVGEEMLRVSSPVREKMSSEMTDEGLTVTTRTSSVASRDTFSFKEKGSLFTF
jgi:hypothetical protein